MQARTYAADTKASPTEVSSILEQRIRGVQEESGLAETGRVLSVGYVELRRLGEMPTRLPEVNSHRHLRHNCRHRHCARVAGTAKLPIAHSTRTKWLTFAI